MYYPIKDQFDSCYKNESRPNGYYLGNEQFENCNIACKQCEENSDSLSTKCLICDTDNNYYKHPTSSSSPYKCILSTTQIDHYFFNIDNFYECDTSCLKCNSESNLQNKCLECDNSNGYYKIYNEESPFKCYNEENKPSKTFISNTDNVIYECNKACLSCNEIGTDDNTKCIECANGYIVDENDSTMCSSICKNYIYTFYDGSTKCTTKLSCPTDFPYLIPSKKECVEICDSYYYEKICYDECPSGTKNIDKNSYECFDVNVCKITNLTTSFTLDEIKSISDSLITSYLNSYSYTDMHVNYYESSLNDFVIVIYKDESCVKELTNNLVFADFDSCFQKLRESNSNLLNVKFTILLINVIKIGESNKVSYLIYNSETGEKIDLSICEKIIVNIPLDQYDNIDIESAEKFASEGIDVFDIEDPFFNDICFSYESEYGTDVTLSDRVENYYQNVSFCDENCNYEGVNYTTNEAICSCNVEEDFLGNLLDNKLTGEVYEIVKSLNI